MKVPFFGNKIKDLIGQADINKAKESTREKASKVSIDSNKNGVSSSSDPITLSPKAGLVSKAVTVAETAPDIRTEKINKIKGDIANGTYKIDSSKVAESIIKDALSEII